jgi:Peptidase family M1 domain
MMRQLLLLVLGLFSLASVTPLRAQQTAARTSAYTRNHDRLMNRYDLLFAHLDLNVPFGFSSNSARFDEGTYVEYRARNTSATTPLDTLGIESFNWTSVSVNGVLVDTSFIDTNYQAEVSIVLPTPIPPGATFTFRVNYGGSVTGWTVPFTSGIGCRPAVYHGYIQTLTSTPGAVRAFDWYPSKQVLDDQLDSAEVFITTDTMYQAASNGLLQRTTALPFGRVRYEWKTNYPIRYHQLVMSLGKYVKETSYAHIPGLPVADSVLIVNYLHKDPATLAAQHQKLIPQKQLLEYFSSKIAPYPFWREKAGICLSTFGTGNENQTMVTLNSNYGIKYTIIAHETCHQWFGNSVGLRSWRDVWISEGLASYGEHMALEDLISPDTALAWLAPICQQALTANFYMLKEQGNNGLSNDAIFDGPSTYNRGVMVFHMMRYLFNDDALFFAGLRSYYQQYAGRTASTEDFKQSMEQTYGQPLDWFFDQWVYNRGQPNCTVRWNQVGSNLVVQCTQTPTNGATLPFFRMPLEIDYRVGTTVGGYLRMECTQAISQQTFSLPPGVTVNGAFFNRRFKSLTQGRQAQRDNSLQPTGLRDDQLAQALHVFPNPCDEFLALPSAFQDRVAEVFDLTGRQVRQLSLPMGVERLPTATLAAGTYVLRLTNSDGTSQQARFSRQ